LKSVGGGFFGVSIVSLVFRFQGSVTVFNRMDLGFRDQDWFLFNGFRSNGQVNDQDNGFFNGSDQLVFSRPGSFGFFKGLDQLVFSGLDLSLGWVKLKGLIPV
jgi:hypothetical protein